MFHMLAYGSASLDGSAGLVTLPAVAETVFMRMSNNFQIPSNLKLLYAYAGGTGITRARLQTASLRFRGSPNIIPMNGALAPGDFTDVMDFRDFPLPLVAQEDLNVQFTNGAANPAMVLVGVATPAHNSNVNANGLRWIRFTSSVTGAAVAWSTPGAIVLEDVLEQGQYGVYGLQVEGALVLGARLMFNNQTYRPGVVGLAAAGQKVPSAFYGGLGLWGTFDLYSLPQIETIESGAGASTPAGYMLVGRVGNSPQAQTASSGILNP
jgi:hypothetical protein